MEYSNNFPLNKTREMSKLWDVDVDRILKVMLSDNKWYKAQSDCGSCVLEITGYVGNKPYYFGLQTTEDFIDEDGTVIGTRNKTISGLVNQIKLIEQEVS